MCVNAKRFPLVHMLVWLCGNTKCYPQAKNFREKIRKFGELNMAKQQKTRGKSTDFLKNANLGTRGAGRNGLKAKQVSEHYKKQDVASRTAADNRAKMAKIEAYAKANNVSIAKAMIHFME